VGQRVLDQLADPLELRGVVDRPQLYPGLGSGAHPDLAGPVGQALDQVMVQRFGYQDPFDARADLAVVDERSPEQPAAEAGHVSVREHDRRVVAAQLEGEPLEIGRGRRGDQLPGLHRPGEADLPHRRMPGHPCPQLVAAADHVDHPGRQHPFQGVIAATTPSGLRSTTAWPRSWPAVT
jgi:hypothetical protein